MKDRREALVILAAGTVALPGVARADGAPGAACEAPPAGPNARHFPRILVSTHLGERAWFYEDLIAGRTVMVSFMSIAGEAQHPVTANLARAQNYLGDRLGKDVFLYSVTIDPGRDTPRALAAFARRHGARPGWLFLRAAEDDVERLKTSFFFDRAALHLGHTGPGYAGLGHTGVSDCSRGLFRYGNEAAGIWGCCPVFADPRWVAARLSWVSPQPPAAGPARRRGPRPLAVQGRRT